MSGHGIADSTRGERHEPSCTDPDCNPDVAVGDVPVPENATQAAWVRADVIHAIARILDTSPPMPWVDLARWVYDAAAPVIAAQAATAERRRIVEVLRDLAAQCRDTSIHAMTREGCDEALAAAVAVDHGADLIANGAEGDGEPGA